MPTHLPYQRIVVTAIKQAKKALLMDHLKTVPCPLVTLTNPKLLTALIATRYCNFSQKNPKDGIANLTHTVRPAGRRTTKTIKGPNKANQARPAAPASIS